MKNNWFTRAETYSLIGLMLGIFSFLFSSWEHDFFVTHTGLDLWFRLSHNLISTPQQQAIFVWLSLVSGGLILQAVATVLMFGLRQVRWTLVSAAIWVVILVAADVLLWGFKAEIGGVVLMILACLIALGGELFILYRNYTHRLQPHAAAVTTLAQSWAASLGEARSNNIPLAILAVITTPPVTAVDASQLQRELRGRDLIHPVKDGFFVLLWQTRPNDVPGVAAKLQRALANQAGRRSQIGSAGYPKDGDDLPTLLERSVQALELAQKIGGDTLAPYSYPPHRAVLDGLPVWEERLAEAAAEQAPLALLGFTTSRALTQLDIHQLQTELRGRDLVAPFDHGCYILLWKTTRQGGEVVMQKLQALLATAGVETRAALAAFPEDGGQLAALVARVDQGRTG